MALPRRHYEEPEEKHTKLEEVKTFNEFDPRHALSSYIDVWKGVMLDPRTFYIGMPVKAGYLNPLLFLLINVAISSSLISLIDLNPTWLISGLAVIPIGSFLSAGLYHIFAYSFTKRAPGGFEGTWRVVAYSSAVLLVTWLPYIGALISLYAIYIHIAGMEQVHYASTGTAVVIVLAPLVLALLIIVAAMLLIGFSILA